MTTRDKDEEETLLFSLAYCSRAVQHLSSADIEAIVSNARIHNSKCRITGWLVYGSGIFFQWLEGEREAVKRLMTSIAADTRHSTIVVLSESEEIRERLFGDWDMELVSAQDIRSVLADALAESTNRRSNEALLTLFKELDSRGVMADFDER